jgi:CheY-like chemotaxis protein
VPASKHILVVEDNADVRSAMTRLLQAAGYRVTSAADGREALQCLRREPPAVILLDLAMPVMTGWQFRAEQQHDPALATIPVVVVSAEEGLSRIAGALGAAGHVPKPVDVDALLSHLDGLTGSSGPERNRPVSGPQG